MCQRREIAETKIDRLISAVDGLTLALNRKGSSSAILPIESSRAASPADIDGDALVKMIGRMNSDLAPYGLRAGIDRFSDEGVGVLIVALSETEI